MLEMLEMLEAEAIEIIREGFATAANPVMLYSIGKDSSVLLRLTQKAFWPAPVPMPLLHIDTSWKFREMIEFRDRMIADTGVRLIVHRNERALAEGINCLDHGSGVHTDRLKTEALKQALDGHGFDLAFGGARRDEEASRAKERIFSVRSPAHGWDPRLQRPEVWNLYNTQLAPGQTMRVFPLSNWTESDVWHYIQAESIPVVPLYFARQRPVVQRQGKWIMVDDARLRLGESERPQLRTVRFRTLGCYPLTAAVESGAASVAEILMELGESTGSERSGRLIDHDELGSMEKKKQDGYF